MHCFVGNTLNRGLRSEAGKQEMEQSVSNGGGKKVDSGYILKVVSTGFANIILGT